MPLFRNNAPDCSFTAIIKGVEYKIESIKGIIKAEDAEVAEFCRKSLGLEETYVVEPEKKAVKVEAKAEPVEEPVEKVAKKKGAANV